MILLLEREDVGVFFCGIVVQEVEWRLQLRMLIGTGLCQYSQHDLKQQFHLRSQTGEVTVSVYASIL